jgi:hypothetical protein
MVLVLGTGAPIFVLFPLLIYAPNMWSGLRSRIGQLKRLVALRFAERNGSVAWPDGLATSHRVPSTFSEWEGSVRQAAFKRSLYWRHRFTFAVLLWMSFISFISAAYAMQAAPIPGLACYLTDSGEWILKADPSFLCFSSEMGKSHLAGAVLVLVFVVLFPSVLYSKLNRISNLHLWHDKDCQFEMGYFYEPLKTAWCYLFIVNHLQLCVLVTVLSLMFWQDPMAMAIAPIPLTVLYVAVVLFGQPFHSRLDSSLEAVFYTVCVLGFGLSILQMNDPENMFIDVRTTRKCRDPMSLLRQLCVAL